MQTTGTTTQQVRNLTSKFWLSITTGILTVMLSQSAFGQLALGLAPMRLEFEMAQGSTQSGTLTLSNDSDTVMRVRSELLDFYIDETGTPQFGRSYPKEAAFSCREWLTMNPRETEIPPKQSVVVRYTLRIPADSPAKSYNCGAGFTTAPALQQTRGNNIRTAVRMVAAFYAIVGKPATEGELSDIKVEPYQDAGQSKLRAVVVLKNFGNRYFRPNGTLQVLDPRGSKLAELTFPALPVLPQREQRFVFPLENTLTTNGFTLQAHVDVGTAEVQEATLRVGKTQR